MQTPYFDSMFDDFGIWQHTDGTKPIYSEGYALDDATRGLLLCLAIKKIDKADVLFKYIQTSKCSKIFCGFATSKREFLQSPASEDAIGQVAWAFGYSASIGYNEQESLKLIRFITSNLTAIKSLRGSCYALLGAVYTDKLLSKRLFKSVADRFLNLDDVWYWPEETMTYGNGIVPYALLRYALVFNDKKAAKTGRNVLEYIESVCTKNRARGPIGNEGWYKKGDFNPSAYSQQPIDVAYMIWAWVAAYQISHDESDLENARLWMQWFDGVNIASSIMYDKNTLKAYDGIDDKNRINYHSGAETNICFLISRWMLESGQTI